MSQLKGMNKPLKGINQLSNVGYISAQEIVATTITVPGLLAPDGALENVVINNAIITNSQIGVEGNNVGYFTSIQSGLPGVGYNVIFYGFDDDYILWDPNAPSFDINAGLNVRDCSLLGNIRICENVISSELTDQDIILRPNGIGDLQIDSGIIQRSTVGNISALVDNGSISLFAGNSVLIGSSNDSVSVLSKSNALMSTVNGDLIFRTDTGAGFVGRKFFSSIVQDSPGVVRLTTTARHNFKVGDQITITNSNSTPPVNGTFTVLSVPSLTTFTISAGVTESGTSGIASRAANNNVQFDMQQGGKIIIPYTIPIQLGDQNLLVGVSGSSGNWGGVSVTSGIVVLSTGQLFIPSESFLTFGSGGSILSSTAGQLMVTAGTELTLVSPQTTVRGTSYLVDIPTTRFLDPILSLGGINNMVPFDQKDRGIEYFYNNNNNNPTSGSTVGSQLGWFGLKRNTNRFTFIPDATNNSEIISGAIGDLEASTIYSQSISFTGTSPNLNLACGEILNASLVRGCGSTGTLTLSGDSNLILNATNKVTINGTSGIVLNANEIQVPQNTPIVFGTSGTRILSTAGSNLLIQSTTISTSSNALVLNRGAIMSLDGTTTGAQRLTTDSTGNIFLVSGTSANVTISTGAINIPVSSAVNFGSTTNLIASDTSGSLNLINSTRQINLSSGTVAIPENSRLVLGTTGTLSGSSGTLVVAGTNVVSINSSSQIALNSPKTVIPIASQLILDGTKGTAILTTNSVGTISLTQNDTAGRVIISAGSTNVNLSNTNVTMSSPNVTVSTGSFSVNSQTIRLDDPIIEIGVNESRVGVDRGIEYKPSVGSTTGRFFGFKESTGRFTVYNSSLNNSEVISGTLGDIQVSGAFVNNVTLTTKGSIDLACGTIDNVSTISGSSSCGSSLTIRSDNSINVTSGSGTITIGTSGDINVLSRSRVLLNDGVPLSFGTNGSQISSTTSGSLTIKSTTSLLLDSETVKITDPVIEIGTSTSTNVDRGLLFVTTTSGTGMSTGTGFIGFKSTTGSLVYYSSATDIGTEVRGTLGNLEIGRVTANNGVTVSGGISVISGNITVTSGGVISSGDVTTRNIFLGGGTDDGSLRSTITAVSGSNLVLTSLSGSVILDAAGTAGNVIVSDSKLQLGTSGAVNLTASSSGALLLNASTIAMSSQSSLTLGTSNSLFTGSDGSLVISNNGGIPNGSGGSIGSGIYISTGSLTIPEETPILFGNPNTNIYSHGDRLYINGYKGTIINGDDITFLGNLNIAGNIQSGTTVDLSSPYIYPLGNYNVVDISNVTQPTIGILEITTATHNNLVVTDRVMLKNTYSDPRIDETYFVSSVVSPTIFRVTTGTVLITGSSTGRIVSDLVEDPQKDVGIQVNWHTGATIGTAAYQTGFFGFKRSTERWTFYNLGKNTNDVFSGTLGNIEAAKVFTNRMSGFVLDGPVTAGSNTIAGTAFQIGGGSIENTPIGINSANLGRFTTLTSTVQTNVNNQSISGRLSYSTERFTVSSATASINPSALVMVSFVSVIGISFNGSGIMPNGTVDGQTKTIIISAMGANCTYTLNFTAGKLVMPNPINPSAVPTKITFKRKGQSLNLVWDNTAEFWVPTGGNGGYVS